MNPISWGRPAAAPEGGWAVVDVETTGFRPGQARGISIAVLGLDADGKVEQSVVSLLNPGVAPGPPHIHGLPADMLEALAGHPPIVPLADFADAYQTQRVLAAVTASAQNHCPVKLREIK